MGDAYNDGVVPLLGLRVVVVCGLFQCHLTGLGWLSALQYKIGMVIVIVAYVTGNLLEPLKGDWLRRNGQLMFVCR